MHNALLVAAQPAGPKDIEAKARTVSEARSGPQPAFELAGVTNAGSIITVGCSSTFLARRQVAAPFPNSATVSGYRTGSGALVRFNRAIFVAKAQLVQ